MPKMYITSFIDDDVLYLGPYIFADSRQEADDIAKSQNLNIEGELYQMLLSDMNDFMKKRVIH